MIGVYGGVLNSIVNNFRLSLTSSTPVTTSGVYGASTLYCTPFNGNQISLYNGNAWVTHETDEFPLALGSLTSGKPYDAFAYSNAGVPTLEFAVWTDDSTRATALTYQNGVLSKSGDTTRRYLGSFYNFGNKNATVTMTIASPCVVTWTGHGLPVNAKIDLSTTGNLPTGVPTTVYISNKNTATLSANTFNISATPGGSLINSSGTQSGVHTATVSTYTEDSQNNRLLFNYYGRLPREMRAPNNAANFNYQTDTYQILNGNLIHKLYAMVGVSEIPSSFVFSCSRSNSLGTAIVPTAIALNTITTQSTLYDTVSPQNLSAGAYVTSSADFIALMPVGLNYVAPIHKSTASGTTTWNNGGSFGGVVIQ